MPAKKYYQDINFCIIFFKIKEHVFEKVWGDKMGGSKQFWLGRFDDPRSLFCPFTNK